MSGRTGDAWRGAASVLFVLTAVANFGAANAASTGDDRLRKDLLDEVEKFNRQYLEKMANDKTHMRAECVDYSEHCGAWARIGYCQSYSSYMSRYCRLSCNECDGGGGGGGGGETCADSREDCQSLAEDGRCRSVVSPSLDVAESCKKSCGVCAKLDRLMLDRQSCSRVGSIPEHIKERYSLSSHYSQYTEAYGFPVTASSSVDPRALMRLCYLVRFTYASHYNARVAAHNNKVRFVVIGKNERTTQLPEFSDLSSVWDERARGFGGHVTAASEENLLGCDKNKWKGMDMGLHEVAHNVHLSGLKEGDPTLFQEIEAAYSSAMAAGKYHLNGAAMYASNDYREYFAEGVLSYLGDTWSNKPPHNADQLQRYDPELYRIMTKVFPCNPRSKFIYLHNDLDQVLSRASHLNINKPTCDSEPTSNIPAKRDIMLPEAKAGAVYTWSREECKVPFWYNGQRFFGCTSASMSQASGSAAWCATSTEDGSWYDQATPSHKNTWGYCSWSGATPSPCPVTVSGKSCKFPFMYLGIMHVTCQGTGWCATETDGSNSMVEWDICDSSCYSSEENEYQINDEGDLSVG